MEHEVHVVERPALWVVAKRLPIALEALGPAIGQAFGEVYGIIAAAEEATAGPPFVIYHSMPASGQPLDVEICAPVTSPFEPREPWQLDELPAGTFASLVHVGPYDAVGPAYDALAAWIEDHALAIAGPPREVYLSPADTPPDQIRTIVEFPVARIPALVG